MPSIIFATYYPWAKRDTPLSQVVLGLCLGWGIMVGKASLKFTRSWPWEDKSAVCLVLAYAVTKVIHDTIYSCQDIADDLSLGLESTAVLFRSHIKLALTSLAVCMAISLYYCGVLAEMGVSYYVIAIEGSVISIGAMIYEVKLDDPSSCWL